MNHSYAMELFSEISHLMKAFIDIQFDAVFDLDLVEYEEFDHVPSIEEINSLGFDNIPSTMGHTQLTSLGRKVKDEIES